MLHARICNPNLTAHTQEPLLKQLLTYVARLVARHTAFGIQYLGNVVLGLAPERVAELEDFAFEATRMLLDSRRGATDQRPQGASLV